MHEGIIDKLDGDYIDILTALRNNRRRDSTCEFNRKVRKNSKKIASNICKISNRK
ncbi:MAG: hypothetical protein HFJ50_05760 [Clostridia bacterium]|nr:hypothetical protein [Clostridia bacterium]